MTEERIARLNALAQLKKQRELTVEELAEQAELRAEYLQSVRQNLMAQLDHTTVVYPDGTRKKLERKAPQA
ncbi:MAG: DUF896 domain-containing protein [Clostridia bacterium]|nr:DUF896 domain-containing protein [Clostridia bacterium]